MSPCFFSARCRFLLGFEGCRPLSRSTKCDLAIDCNWFKSTQTFSHPHAGEAQDVWGGPAGSTPSPLAPQALQHPPVQLRLLALTGLRRPGDLSEVLPGQKEPAGPVCPGSVCFGPEPTSDLQHYPRVTPPSPPPPDSRPHTHTDIKNNHTAIVLFLRLLFLENFVFSPEVIFFSRMTSELWNCNVFVCRYFF